MRHMQAQCRHSFQGGCPAHRGGFTILVRGEVEFDLSGGGALSQNLLNKGVSLKIAWKLHDFEQNLGGKGAQAPKPPGSASEFPLDMKAKACEKQNASGNGDPQARKPPKQQHFYIWQRRPPTEI